MSAPTDPDVIKALSRMAITFGHALKPAEIEIFIEALDELPVFDVVRACREISAHERFWPRPVVVRAYVARLQRQREATHTPARASRPEVWRDPTTGLDVQVYACSACQDQGFVPVTEAGAVIPWDQALGINEYAGAQIKHHHVDWCTACNKLRKPTRKLTRPTYDDEQEDRRR